MKMLFYCISMLLLSCTNSLEKKKEWMKSNGVEEIKIGDTEITSKILNYKKNESAGNSFLYMNIRLDKNSQERLDKSKELYADFDIEKDFSLKLNSSELPASFCQRITNGKANSYEYIVAFSIPDKSVNNGIRLLYNDIIFGVGKVAFDYDKSYLKNQN